MKKLILILALLCVSIATFGQAKAQARGMIWKPNSYCDFSSGWSIPCQVFCRDCYWNTVMCEDIAKKGSFTGVHVVFKTMSDTTFELTSHFKNISLITKSGKTVHPYAILWHNYEMDPKTEDEVDKISFMISKFRTKSYRVTIKPKTAYDLIFLFKEAATGDVVILGDFFKAEISK